MNAELTALASQVERLDEAIRALEACATKLDLPSPRATGWYKLFHAKLLVQVQANPCLIAAVVGGTNIGKSVVFNHIAGESRSAVSPLAAGTKHPVALVSPELADVALLEVLFDGFEVRRWNSVEDPLQANESNLLFWTQSEALGGRLILLDVPDIDSDVEVNWERAHAVRRAADVLVAVLTQQKYNDAAVKRFFREAAQTAKTVLIVINQCDLQADRDYWPQWLGTFCRETGVHPEAVCVVPWDRKAAEQGTLRFFDVGTDGTRAPETTLDLRHQIASLRFDAIKLRTFHGALVPLTDRRHGLPAYLSDVAVLSEEFAAAGRTLSAGTMARVHWPALPTAILVDEIRTWWHQHRGPWSRRVHGFYRQTGQYLMRPAQWAWRYATNTPTEEASATSDRTRAEEARAMVVAVENMIDELERLAEVGSEALRPRVQRLLRGSARRDLLQRVREAHAALPAVDDEYRTFLRRELDAWREANPGAITVLRYIDQFAAMARPAITVTLAVSGLALAGDVAGQATMHAAGHLATEAVITGGVTGGGEAVVSGAGAGIRGAAARLFQRLQQQYAKQRADWLAAWLERELLGELLEDLRAGAAVVQSDAFRSCEAIVADMRSHLAQHAANDPATLGEQPTA